MKTINGKSTERIGDRIDFYPEGSTTEPFLPTAPATLIQWDGPPQRVLTESEVKAMLREVVDAERNTKGIRSVREYINIALAKHNITL